jgi:hypothetical protein
VSYILDGLETALLSKIQIVVQLNLTPATAHTSPADTVVVVVDVVVVVVVRLPVGLGSCCLVSLSPS